MKAFAEGNFTPFILWNWERGRRRNVVLNLSLVFEYFVVILHV